MPKAERGPEYMMIARLETVLPGSTRRQRKELIREAHKISCSRRDSPTFCPSTVLSVIRGSIKGIREGLGNKSTSELFKRQTRVIPVRSYVVKFDPSCYLVPNETWAGKGSGGKHNFSQVSI